MRYLVLVLSLSGCVWDCPTAPPKHVRKEQCIKIINGRYYYVDDCKYWGHMPSSDAETILPP
jgi:hypothetical protein